MGLQLSQNTAQLRHVSFKGGHLSDSSKLRVFSLQRVRAWAVLLTQSCCGKASKNVPVWRWGLASLTSTRHWNHYEISSETSDSSQFSRLEFIMTAFKSTAEVTLTNWFQISIVKHCIMSLFWISPKSGLLSYFILMSHLQHDTKSPLERGSLRTDEWKR